MAIYLIVYCDQLYHLIDLGAFPVLPYTEHPLGLGIDNKIQNYPALLF